MSKKALLMILDGWGIGDQGKDDVIFNTILKEEELAETEKMIWELPQRVAVEEVVAGCQGKGGECTCYQS